MANGNIHALRIGSFTKSFREAPLTMTTLAGLVPAELNAHIHIHDENVEKLDPPKYLNYDLIAISAMTGTAVRAYEIADYYRRHGKTVVLGGIHVSIYPEEAKEHADCIVVGYAEKIWPMLLRDFVQKKMKARYDCPDESELENLPHARRDLQNSLRYVMPNTIMATRGCPHVCDFCTIPVVSKKYSKRPVNEIAAEVATLKGKRFAINDVSLIEDREWSIALFKQLAPLKKVWGGLCVFKIYKDKELMHWLKKSGCKYMLVGFESLSQHALKTIYKGFNQVEDYQEGMKVFHDHGIAIQGCFVFGFDHDTQNVFAETVEQVNKLKIDIPRYSIYTPYPETALFKRLVNENRVLTKDWSLYDTQHVVIRPANMTPEKLHEGFRWAYQETFKFLSISKRTIQANLDWPITFVGNLAYNIYVKRLYSTEVYVQPAFYEMIGNGHTHKEAVKQLGMNSVWLPDQLETR